MQSKTKQQNAIKLNKPDMERKTSLMCALASRKSTRSFNNKPLEMQDLSDLLWAANGINRPDSKGHTASNSFGKGEVAIYACTPQGTCLYCPDTHALIPVTLTNLMPALAGGQEYVLSAPVILLLVADVSIFDKIPEPMHSTLAPLDTGIISQNIALFCAANCLDTVARGTMNYELLKAELKLKDTDSLLLNHPVGYSNV